MMKTLKGGVWAILSLFILMITACGGGGSDGSSGTLSMNISDAKPMLPEGTKNVWITFEEVLVHKPGGGWISLPLAQTPYTIDLFQFHSGNTTELVPPVSLETGKYTQIRIVVTSATIGIEDGGIENDYQLTIPSENLKTDKNFPFDVQGGGAIDITVDFDLSQSIVVTGLPGTPSYKLKPVLHIVETLEAGMILGSIALTTFEANNSTEATVTVIWDKDMDRVLSGGDEEYTRVTVPKDDPAEFNIFWLVPDQGYTVQVDMGGGSLPGPEFEEFVEAVYLEPGSIVDLNNGVEF